jgi:hypothetical protein
MFDTKEIRTRDPSLPLVCTRRLLMSAGHSHVDEWDRAIAQAVSLWLPTAAARVHTCSVVDSRRRDS